MSDENKPETRQIEHTLPPVWQQHIKEVLLQLQLAEGEITQAKALIFDKTPDVVMMRKHLGVLIGELAKAEQLPESVGSYNLSPDGAKILGQVAVEESAEEDLEG